MTIRRSEQIGQEVGVSHVDPSSKREWLLWGSTSRDEIMAEITSFLGDVDVCAGTPRYFSSYSLKELTTGVWRLTVDYKKIPASYELSVDTSGGTGKILVSRDTIAMYDAGGGAFIPSHNGSIGVNGNNVEGVDIVIPKFDFTISYKWAMSRLTATYLKTIYELTGCVNDEDYPVAYKDQIITFKAGDLRFMGAPMKQTSDDQLDIQYRFSASKGIEVIPSPGNAWGLSVAYFKGDLVDFTDSRGRDRVYKCLADHTATALNSPEVPSARKWRLVNLHIGDSVAIAKRGWEYLWVQYVEERDAASNTITKRPGFVYIEEVCPYGKFADLELDMTGL